MNKGSNSMDYICSEDCVKNSFELIECADGWCAAPIRRLMPYKVTIVLFPHITKVDDISIRKISNRETRDDFMRSLKQDY